MSNGRCVPNNGQPFGLLTPWIQTGECVPNGAFFKEKNKTIGGVGKTTRWEYSAGPRLDSDPLRVLIFNISVAPDAFDSLLESIGSNHVYREAEYELVSDDEDLSFNGLATSIVITQANAYARIAVQLLRGAHFKPIIDEDGPRNLQFEIGVERFDRAKWNFHNQKQNSACPKQSFHKWGFAWMPDEWSVLPFTWYRLAQNMDDTSIDNLPMPLRMHTTKLRMDQIDEELKRRFKWSHRASDPRTSARHGRSDPIVVLSARRQMLKAKLKTMDETITSTLRPEQAKELLFATYTLEFTSPSPQLRLACAEVLRRYILYGHAGRIFGPYSQSAKFVGMGKKRRMFVFLRQYRPENLPMSTVSRIYDPETGSLTVRDKTMRKKKRHAYRERTDKHYCNNLRRDADDRLTFFGNT